MNKKLLFVILLFTSSFLSIGQIVSTPNDTLEETATQTDPFTPTDVHIKVINTQNNNITYTWELKNFNTPNGWGRALCDNNNCYDLTISPGPYESLAVSPGDTMDMKFQFAPNCIGGTGWADVLIYITGDSANTATTFHYIANVTSGCPNGVSNVAKNALHVFPNPFINSFSVTGIEHAGNISFEVYDMKGSLVPAQVLSATNSSIDIALPDAPEGSYLLKATDTSGALISTALLHKNK